MNALSWPTLALAILALPLTAQSEPAPGPRAGRIAQALHLTDAQRAGLQAVRAKHRPELQARRETTRGAQAALQAALADAGTSAPQLRALYDQAAAARFDLLLARRSARQEALALLTPEQRLQAAEMRGAARERLRHLRAAAGLPG
jgi:Spy/CpxP family protein refolding chaperone